MNAQGNPSMLVTVLIMALIAWRLYARFRRLIGRQPLSKWRPWVTVTVLPLIFTILGVLSRHQPAALWALGGGAVVGIGLGILGLKLTRFETTPEGACYTPSAHLGIALSTVLVLRIAYRFIQAQHYVTYAVGLIRWSSITGNATPAPVVQTET